MKYILSFATIYFILTLNAFSEEGSYEYSNVGSHNLAKVNTLDGTVTGGKLQGISIITKSKGNLYEVGQNSETTCIILSKKESKSNHRDGQFR